jgi:hypothetical protein
MAKDEALPFGVGGGLVAIKTLLSRDPCVHANTAIEMIDAILKEHPAAQPAPVQEPWKYRRWNDEAEKWELTDDCGWPSEPVYTAPPAQPAPAAFEVGLVEWVGNKLMATPKTTTTAPASWMEMVTANLVREGVNKHKARELAEHFYGLAQPAPVQPVWIQPDHLQKAQKAPFLCRVEPHKRDDFVPLYPTPPAAPVQPIGEVIGRNEYAGLGQIKHVKTIEWFGEPAPVGTKLYTTPPAPAQPAVQETVSGYIKKIEDLIQERDDARSSRDFYKRRADALQEWQSKMRDPERTIVCDILANGCTLEPAGDRYTPPAQPAPVHPVDGTQVSKVWWDGEWLMAKPIPLEDFYQPVQEPEIVQRVKRYAGQTMRTARNPNITARECIELANWLAANTTTPLAAPTEQKEN